MSAPEDTGSAHDSSYETAAQPREARADSTVRFTPGTLLAGRYRIVSPLGKGGMGEVYRADDIRPGQPVALKFLPPAFAADSGRIERLVDEVRVGRQISHPNVCRLYDIAEAEGHHFLVMEYVDGEDLASLLRRIGRLPGDKALDIARGICAGLAAAHDKGIIHRDLKPANVMIDGRGHARIADFGLAALAGGGGVADMSGTPHYMAPEQLTGEGASLRSDVYALGLVLHEMLTGKKVYEAKSLNELRALHAETQPPGLSSSSPSVDNLFRQALVANLAATLIVGVVFRLGLLSAAVMGYVFLVLLHLPLTTHGSSWYAGASALGLMVVGGLAIYGFIVSLAGKTPFGRPIVGP